MKTIQAAMAAGLGLLGFLWVEPQGNTVYEDTQICTMYDSIRDWNMTHTGTQTYSFSQPSAPFSHGQALDLRSLVFADQSTPEVFGLARQGNFIAPANGFPAGKRGGYSQLVSKTAGGYDIEFDRGTPDGDISHPNGTINASNFYTTPATGGFTYTPTLNKRNFKTNTGGKKRASMKIDYVCAAPSVPGYTMWLPIGPWDMSTRSITFPSSSASASVPSYYGLDPARVIDMAATIYSDPDEYGYIQTDYLEHLGVRNIRGRGGRIWMGFGCRVTNPDASSPGGYGDCAVGTNTSTTTYLYYKLRLWSGGGVGGMHRGYGYTSTADNRGWVKLQYTGSKITTRKVPYAMKTRVIATGPWDMTSGYYLANSYLDIPLYELAVHPGRVSNISTTIFSDPAPSTGAVTTTNFHRPPTEYGTDNGRLVDLGGGMTFIDQSNGVIRLHMSGNDNGGVLGRNFYNNSKYSSTGSYNRGHVAIDYVAGGCPQGPSSLQVDAIPSGPNREGNCEATTQPFTLWGAGDARTGIHLTEGQTEDAFTFFSKSVVNNGTKILTVKVNSLDYTNGWAGITMRVPGKGKDVSHVTLMVDAYGNVKFITRNGTGNANVLQGSTSTSFPVWLGLMQNGSNVYARIDTRTTPPEPSAMENYWETEVGDATDQSDILSPSNFDIGMVVSNYDYWGYNLTKASMSFFNEEW